MRQSRLVPVAGPGRSVTVLHVLPADAARGSQVHAKALRSLLDEPGCSHRLLTIFASPDFGMAPDVALEVPSGRLRATGADPRALARLRHYIARTRPDVVVAHGGEPLKYLALLRGRWKLVYFAIGVVGPKVHRAPNRQLYTWLLGRADLVVGVSQAVADECAVLLGVPEAKLAVAPNGRDPGVYHPEAKPAGPPFVLFAGHLTPHKRPDLFVDVVAGLRQQGAELRAAIAGDGPMAATLSGPAAIAGVELLGERGDMPGLLAQADIFVFPSTGENEGMPGVLIEAGLCAVPVVTTRVPGAGDVVDDGRTGLIVPPDDKDALMVAVGRLLSDPHLRAGLGQAARERCTSRFSLEAGAAVWRRCIEGLTSGTGDFSSGVQGRPSSAR